ncbi:MAG: hypothetical protein H6Q69_155 [Firmicutes bacterium]|nr:hypothetical protein [Bacillota bacterium]
MDDGKDDDMGFTNRKQKRYLSELQKSLLLAGPLVAALLSQKGMQVVNSIVLGSLGPEALAASALADSLYGFLWVLGIGILSAVGVLIARAYGEKNDSSIAIVFFNSIYITFLFSIIAISLLWIAPGFLSLLGQEAIVVAETVKYMHTLIWGLPALLGFFALLEFSSSLNHPRIAMYFSLMSIPLVAFANYLFAYGRFGLPAMGIAGVGISTALVQWSVFIGFYWYVLRHQELGKYLVPSLQSRVSLLTAREIFRIGFPAGLINVLETALGFGAAIMMGCFGTVTLAAHQIIMISTTVLCRFPMALGITSAIRVSQNVGMKKYGRIKPVLYSNLLLGLVLGSIFGVILISSPETLVGIFLDKSQGDYFEVMGIARSLLVIAAITQLLDYVMSTMNGSLRGLKDTFVPMLICLSSFWIAGIGGGYLLAFKVHLNGIGVWTGQVLGLGAASFLLYLRFNRTHKKVLHDAQSSKTYLVNQEVKTEEHSC